MQNKMLKRLKLNFPNFKSFSKNFCSKSSQNDSVIFTQHNPYVLEVTLNKPKQLNSLDSKMIKTLLKKVRKWVPDSLDSSEDENASFQENKETKSKNHENEEIIPKVMILQGAGNKAFCAGGDIVDIYKAYNERNDVKAAKDFFR